MIRIAISISTLGLLVACSGTIDDAEADIGEEGHVQAWKIGENKEKESEAACVSLQEECPEHCYVGRGGRYDSERGCFEEHKPVICSPTPSTHGANAPIFRHHIESGDDFKIGSGAIFDEFYDDELWETGHHAGNTCVSDG